MKKILLLSAAFSLALAAPALAQGQNPGTFHWHDSRQQSAPQNRPAAPAAQNRAQNHAQNRDQNRGASRHDSRSNNGPAMHRDSRADNNRRDSNRGRYDRHDNNRGNVGRGNIGRGQHHDWRAYHRSSRATHRFHAPRYHRPSGWYARRWTFGELLPSLFWAPQYWLNNYFAYDLPPPPAGTVWVRNGDDAILIDRYTGEIVMVEYDVFY